MWSGCHAAVADRTASAAHRNVREDMLLSSVDRLGGQEMAHGLGTRTAIPPHIFMWIQTKGSNRDLMRSGHMSPVDRRSRLATSGTSISAGTTGNERWATGPPVWGRARGAVPEGPPYVFWTDVHCINTDLETTSAPGIDLMLASTRQYVRSALVFRSTSRGKRFSAGVFGPPRIVFSHGLQGPERTYKQSRHTRRRR